jgi:hypothetical protein
MKNGQTVYDDGMAHELAALNEIKAAEIGAAARASIEQMEQQLPIQWIGLPPQSWSTVIVRKRRIRDGEQTTQTGRDRHEVTAG